MQPEPVRDADIAQLVPWFPDADSLRRWAGPGMRFPMTTETAAADLGLDARTNRVLRDEHGRLMAFGQYYAREGRCHLARIAVDPARRGQGIGEAFVAALMAEGTAALGLSDVSIFVDADNARVLPLYRRLGFAEQRYPGHEPAMADSLYLDV